MDASKDKTSSGRFNSIGGRDISVSPPAAGSAKEDWIRLYTGRILGAWLRRRTPLGLARTYATWIRGNLSELYEQPLLKTFVERTYPGSPRQDAAVGPRL